MSDQSLADLLNDEVEIPEIDEAEEVEQVEEETESTDEEKGLPSEPEDQKEEQTETEETQEEEEKGDTFSEREKAFLAKANDEKAKRQELERKLAEKEEPQEELPDPVEDPEGYAKALEQRNAQSQFAMRVTLSQELMREKHPDYDEKEAIFAQLAKDDPSLGSRLHSSSNPAKFAYDIAVKHERMSQFDNFDDAVKSEVEKQVRTATEKLRAELEKEYEGKLKTATSLPPSGAKGSIGSDDTIPGEESLTDILGH